MTNTSSQSSTTTTTGKSSPTDSFPNKNGPVVIPPHVAVKAISNYYFESPTGCHVSNYSTASHGYAQIGWHTAGEARRATTAHRAAWAAIYGQIPDGMTIDHTCKNRRCVNVQHLRMLPNFENARRTKGRDWPVDGRCIKGHSPEAYMRRDNSTRATGFCGVCFPRMLKAAERHLLNQIGIFA